jgi:hypothetical protein
VSYSAADPQRSLSGEARRQNALSLLFFLCAAFAFVLRFAVSSQLMDMVMDYTAASGAFYEKLHFGTYAIYLLLPFVLFTRPFVLRGDEIGKFKALVRFSGLMLALVIYLFATGRAGSSGFIIDTYIVAAAAGLLMYGLHADLRRALGDVTLCLLILSAVMGIVEEITHHRFLPYGLVELQFRPIGLTDHPLSLGALCATAIGFVVLTRWRAWVRVAAIFVLFIGCAASGARFSLLVSVGEILALLLFVRWPRLTPANERKAKFVVLMLTLAGGVVLVAGLFAGGLLNRFSHTIFDENFMARVTIYQVFDYVDWKQIMFGMRADDLIAIVNERLKLPTIESAPVVLIMLLGLPLAILFIILVFWILLRLLRKAPLPAWIGTTAFILAALSNNTLSSKTSVIAIIVVLLVAYGAPRPQTEPEAVA